MIHTNKVELGEQNILFIGKLDWKPNSEGLIHFIEQCWKKILDKCQNAKLFVAGKGLSENDQNLISSYKNIELLGFVPDVYDFYSKGNIVIAPIYSGAGTNIKVIEAMAMAKACVMTQCATRGFEHILQHEQNALIVNTDDEFIDNVVKLIEDKEIVRFISGNAMETVGAEYSQAFLNNLMKDKIYG